MIFGLSDSLVEAAKKILKGEKETQTNDDGIEIQQLSGKKEKVVINPEIPATPPATK